MNELDVILEMVLRYFFAIGNIFFSQYGFISNKTFNISRNFSLQYFTQEICKVISEEI
jgi:hypothetical protein